MQRLQQDFNGSWIFFSQPLYLVKCGLGLQKQKTVFVRSTLAGGSIMKPIQTESSPPDKRAWQKFSAYKARTSVKKRLQFASLILVFGMQICVSLYHSRFCRSASCNHRDPEAVITHSGIQMFKCKLRLSNPPRHKHANCCWWCCIQCKPVYFEGTEAYGHVLSDESLAGDSFLLEGTGGCGTQSLKGLQAAYSYRELYRNCDEEEDLYITKWCLCLR